MNYKIQQLDAIKQILGGDMSKNMQRNYMIAEDFILEILESYLEKQGKKLIRVHNSRQIVGDAYSEEGIDEYIGKTLFEIKFYKDKIYFAEVIRKILNNINRVEDNVKNIIIISILEITEDDKLKILHRVRQKENLCQEIKIDIWDINKLEKFLTHTNEEINNIIEKTNNNYLQSMIVSSIKEDTDWKEKREKLIDDLKDQYKEDNVALFLGAGASAEAKIPQWNSLVSELFVNLLSTELKNQKISINEKDKNLINKRFKDISGDSPLMQARYLRNGLKDKFQENLKEVLYKETTNTSPLIEEIVKLCTPERNKEGIRGIINYNFDDLIECNLEEHRIRYKPIFRDGITPTKHELGIYHVHGFLPRNNNESDMIHESLLVFSEEGYHELMMDPYNWANLIQLSYMRENTCLFIGLSVTDPNLRRLLDISMRKNSEAEYKHYVILQRKSILPQEELTKADAPEDIMCFENVNYKLQEDNFKELGLNIIWIENFKEIPNILKRIKV